MNAVEQKATEPDLDLEAEPPSIEAPRGHPLLPGFVNAL
jgi:hypothetical protein